MKKYNFIAISILLFIYSCSNNAVSQNYTLTKIKKTEQKLKTPESVLFNQSENILYVSNINGDPLTKDQNGFISKIDKNGNIIDLQWITGLNAPKGMGIFNNFLYVTDIDQVVKIDIQNSQIIKKYNVKNAKFLNDIAIDAQGNVYISDMIGNKIYKLSGNQISIWLSNDLNSPNGLEIDKNYLYIGNGGYLLKSNLQTKKSEKIFNKTGVIDGLKKDKQNNFIISDWLGNISLLKNGQRIILKKAEPKINAADFELINDTLFVPTFIDNAIEIYKINYK